MAKKTKKEKVIAEYRRKLHQFHETTSSQSARINPLQESQQIPSSSHYAFQAAIPTTQNSGVNVQPMDQAIHRDLIKTLVLAAIAMGAEVGLSVLMRK